MAYLPSASKGLESFRSGLIPHVVTTVAASYSRPVRSHKHPYAAITMVDSHEVGILSPKHALEHNLHCLYSARARNSLGYEQAEFFGVISIHHLGHL